MVIRVVDGDTIHVRIGGREETVRYIGMDTPESVKPGTPVQPLALAASAANAKLVGGRNVVLEKDVSERDQYGRLLRNVWITQGTTMTLVGYQLVVLGYAAVTTFPPDVKYVDQLLNGQRWAREHGLGLWGLAAPTAAAAASPGSRPIGLLAQCDPSYPDTCIPPPPPDLDCVDIGHRVRVQPPDPHHLDGDHNGIGCELYPP